MVTINGEEKNAAGKTIYAYLSEEGYDTSRVDRTEIAADGRPLLAATMFGVTTPCIKTAKAYLEAQGYEAITSPEYLVCRSVNLRTSLSFT